MHTPLKKILYVEDDLDIAAIAKLTLETLGGFDVLHCASGQEALDAVPTYEPQLFLVDVMMPRMNGMETLARLRLIPQSRHTPIIFMTARAQTHEQRVYLELGALGVVVKPFDPMTLSDSIKELWEKRHNGYSGV